ncbi:MAG: succinylglutamate desuccinylase/aspartoacylase family protein, partial [bacterium]
MKILVIGGAHGNEPLGIDLVKMINNNPIKNVQAIFGNEMAIKRNSRFGDLDFDECFPGKKNSKVYEYRQSYKILELSKKVDIVLDFHNTYCSNNDCGIYDENGNDNLRNITKFLGLKRIVISDCVDLDKFATNSLTVEISRDSKLFNTKYWYEKVKKLSELDEVKADCDLPIYKFIYTMTLEDRDKYGLNRKGFKAFKKIDSTIAKKLGVKSPAYPVFIADKYTLNYFGYLLNKVDE